MEIAHLTLVKLSLVNVSYCTSKGQSSCEYNGPYASQQTSLVNLLDCVSQSENSMQGRQMNTALHDKYAVVFLSGKVEVLHRCIQGRFVASEAQNELLWKLLLILLCQRKSHCKSWLFLEKQFRSVTPQPN
jgi:hypothetical protein